MEASERVRQFKLAKELVKQYPKEYKWFKFGPNGRTHGIGLASRKDSEFIFIHYVYKADFRQGE